MKNSKTEIKKLKGAVGIVLMAFVLLIMPISVYAAGQIDWDQLLPVPDNTYEENPENRMAHNVYSDPNLSQTSGQFNGFIIDFKADKVANATYWALCNWVMSTEDLESRYTVTDKGVGAYAGMQRRFEDTVAIMSFWQIKYLDDDGKEQIIEAQRVYPSGGETNLFGGEGEGTNYICNFPWQAGKWYRMYLNCVDDENGKTYVEQWIKDIEAGKWYLISRFDTGLYHSYFMGQMSQFMENYYYTECNNTRSFEYRNINVRECGKSSWTAISGSTLSVDTYYGNKKGNAKFGALPDRFYGVSNGYGQDQYEENEDVSGYFVISPMHEVSVPTDCLGEHNYVKTDTVNATCENSGKIKYKCLNCSFTKQKIIPAKGHTKAVRNKKKATYKVAGYTGDVYCKVCSKVLEKGEVIPKLKAKKQNITVKKSLRETATFKYSKLKKAKILVDIKAKAKGKLVFEVTQGEDKNISVSKKGIITLKKGCQKGLYKVKITALATKNGEYKKCTKTIKLRVK